MQHRHEIASPLPVPETEQLSPKITAELVSAGALERLAEAPPIYHGRATNGDKWHIDPHFQPPIENNAYQGVLYATHSPATALNFARSRVYGREGYEATAERLVPTSDHWTLITGNVSSDVGEKLQIGLTSGAPVRNDLDRAAVDELFSRPGPARERMHGAAYLTDNDIEELAKATVPQGTDVLEWANSVRRYVTARNSLLLIHSGQLIPAARVMSGKEYIEVPVAQGRDGEWQTAKAPFSAEYTAEVFRRAGIVGFKSDVNSATLGKTVKDVIAIWNKASVQEQGESARRHEHMDEVFDGFDERLAKFSVVPEAEIDDPEYAKLRNMLQDPFVQPHTAMKAAREIPKIRRLLDMSSGVWEGYTVGEHTEAVLNNFERYFADRMPAELTGFMRTALFVHDIGKGVAAERGEKHKQEGYNVAGSEYILRNMGHNEQDVGLVTDIIGEGARLISDYYRQGLGKEELGRFVRRTAERITGRSDDRAANGVWLMLDAINLCDMTAYTENARFVRGRRVVRGIRSFERFLDFAPHGTHALKRKTKK